MIRGSLHFADPEELVLEKAEDLSHQKFGQSLPPEVFADLDVEHSSRGEAPTPAVAFEFPDSRSSGREIVRQLIHQAEFDRFQSAPHAIVPP